MFAGHKPLSRFAVSTVFTTILRDHHLTISMGQNFLGGFPVSCIASWGRARTRIMLTPIGFWA